MHSSLFCYGGASVCVVCGARLLLQVCMCCWFVLWVSSHAFRYLFCYCGASVRVVCGARLLLHVGLFCGSLFMKLSFFCYGGAIVRIMCGARLLLHAGMFLRVSFHAVRFLLLWLCKCSFRASFVACWFVCVHLFSCI